MLEYGLLSGMGGASISGVWDAVLRAGSEVLDAALDHPLIAFGIVLVAVYLLRDMGTRRR